MKLCLVQKLEKLLILKNLTYDSDFIIICERTFNKFKENPRKL